MLFLVPLLFFQADFSLNGVAAGDNLGNALANLGDVNGDSVHDFAIGISGDDTVAEDAGAVVVISGADGSEIHRYFGDAPLQRMGWQVCATGDLDGDGVPDLAVAAKKDNQSGYPSGFVRIWSMATGAEIRTLTSASSFDRFGYALSNAGDVDADGIEDLLVGAPEDHWQGAAAGALLHLLRGQDSWDMLGTASTGMGDLNMDGYADFAFSARQEDTRGRDAGAVHIYSGRTGAELARFKGRQRNSHFGVALVRVADLDGDGRDEIGVSALNRLTELFSADGYVEIWSMLDTETPLVEMAQPYMGDDFGACLTCMDIDQDGAADLLIGAPRSGMVTGAGLASGKIWAMSGRSGRPLLERSGSAPGEYFGSSVCPAQDVNGDARPDFVVGASGSQGVGWVGTQHSPVFLVLQTEGALVGGQTGTIRLDGAFSHSTIFFQASLSGWGWTTLGPNIGLDIASPLYDLGSVTADAQGSAAFSGLVPNSLIGRTLWLQAWAGNIYGPEGSSNALALVIQ
jgi:hypothetical protein